MKKLILLLCFVATSLAVDDFFASTPRELRPGKPYYIDIAFPTSPRAAVTIEAKIKQTNNAREVSVAWSGASASTTISATYTGRITIQVPGDLLAETKYYLFLEVDGLIQPSKEVVVATVPNLIFVQTDRGIYKPSASLNDETKVKLRVLRVNDELKPVMGDNLKLEIKDPRNETIWLKRDFPHDKGIAEAEWVVPRDPVYGTYIALAEGDWGKANATFDVQKYELPKFEVQCTLDNSYVVDPFYFGETKGDVTIEGSCKAVYTYGAYVKGTMKIKAGNAEETFSNFDGEERFSLRIVRNRQGEDNQIEVFAEMTEKFTEDTANATMSFSVYDAEHRALVIKPIPNTLEGDSDYKFFAQLVDASGQRVQNFQNFMWFVRAVLKYNSFNAPQQTSTETYEGTLSSNPVEIVLPSGNSKGDGAYYSEIEVKFNEIDTGRASLPEKFSPTRYKSDTNQALFINIMDKTTEKEISNTEAYEYNGSEVCFKVRKSGTETLGAVFYQIIGTTYPGQLMKVTGPITCVTIRKHMAPKAMLIAYTIVGKEGNKEILAASLTFDVTWESPHKVSITITPAEARPNQDVNIHIKTEGQALVGLDGIDKSILFLAGVKSLTEDRIKQRLGENRMFGREEKQESNYPGPMPMFRSYIPFPSGPETTSAGAKIKDAGLMVISNANVYGNQERCLDCLFFDRPMAMFAFRSALAGGNEQEDAMASVPTSEENASKPKQTSSIRKDFPETWLFDVVTTDANGEFDLQKRCPGTITTFLVNGYAMNEAKGLGVAEQAQLKCFQPFFVRANLPYSMKKGEESDFQMLVFNYYTEATDVRVSLKENPVIFSTTGPTSTVLTVQPGSSAEFKVPIKPTKIGAHDVEVAAVWSDRGITDKVIKQLRIEPPGKEIRVYKEISVDVDSSETRSATFELEEFFVETMTYIVPESLKMEIQVSGDMIGAFISNLEGAMPMPTGCGEQNMITVIPSVFLFPYLKNIDRDTPDMREKVARYCAKGYAKELVYKHRDGSFSAFGEGPGLCGCMPFGMVDGEEDDTFPSKPGSSWLTAFVLYVFSIMGEQELTYVNHDTLHESFVFLKKTHGRDGHFEVIGDVVHQEMKGGTSEKIGYSAYVLLAFTNYKKFLDKTPTATDQQKEDVRTMIDGGKQWLIARKDNSMTKFEIGIAALFMARNGEYAEARALLAKAEGAKMALNCPKNSYGPPEEAHIAPCWKTKSRETRCDPSDKTSCAEGQVCCQTNCPGYRCVPGQGPSLVETKGYLALAYLALNDYADHKDKIKPNVDWLLENRKGSHFDNTQDTAVALQALAEYGLKFKDDAVADFTVSVPANSPVSSPASVDVDSSNYEILQRQPLDVQWTSDIKSKIVTANVAGTFGKAFVTLSVIFHSTNEKQVPKVLDLTVDATKPVNGSITHIKSCWRGRKPVTDDDPKISNMVVVEINLQTGTRYKEESANLEDLELAGVTKIEKDNGKVTLYFEPEEKKKYDHDNCVYLPVEKEFEVRNVAMGKVKGYDYYAMSESTQEAFYATEDCYENCGPPGPTGPTTGASSIYISGLLLVGALLITLAGFRME